MNKGSKTLTCYDPATPELLERIYQGINEHCFRGKLPKAKVVFGDRMKLLGRTSYAGKRVVIAINRRSTWNQSEPAITLIHEIVHIAWPGCHHGKKFAERVFQIIATMEWWGLL